MKTLIIQNRSQIAFIDCADADGTKYRHLEIYSRELKDVIADIRITDDLEIKIEIYVIYKKYQSFIFSIEMIEEIVSIAKEYKLKMIEQLG